MVLEAKADRKHGAIINAVYRDIVTPDLFTYAHFITTILACIKEGRGSPEPKLFQGRLNWQQAK